MKTLLNDLFMFDSVPWTCIRRVSKRCTLINVINSCCTLSVSFYLSVWIFGIAETGTARGSPPGTTTEVQRVGFPSAEIRFVSNDHRFLQNTIYVGGNHIYGFSAQYDTGEGDG
jgi:hypothetical protein